MKAPFSAASSSAPERKALSASISRRSGRLATDPSDLVAQHYASEIPRADGCGVLQAGALLQGSKAVVPLESGVRTVSTPDVALYRPEKYTADRADAAQ